MPKKSSNHTLITIINDLSIGQVRDLIKFLNLSSIGVTQIDREVLTHLIELIKKNKKLEDNTLWNSTFQHIDSKERNRIKNRLLTAIEYYICLLEIRRNEGIKMHLLTTWYFKNNLGSNLKQALSKGIRKLSAIKDAIPSYRIILYWLHEKLVFIRKDIRQESVHFDSMEEELTDFYAINKLRIICERINRSEILNSDNDAPSFQDEVEYLKSSSDSIFVNIYYQLYQLLNKDQYSRFVIINEEIEKLSSTVNSETIKEVHVHLMNYCIRKINERKLEYAEQFISYSKLLDSNGILLDQNIMSIGRFKNILVVCYIIDDPTWAKYIIDKYSDYLQETKDINRQEFLLLNKAILALWQNEFDKCINYIHNFQSSSMYHKDVYYKIACDKLLLKVFFEKGEFDSLVNKISVLIVYIRNRKKLSKKRKTPNLKFLYILDKINRNKTVNIDSEKENILLADYIWLKRVLKKG